MDKFLKGLKANWILITCLGSFFILVVCFLSIPTTSAYVGWSDWHWWIPTLLFGGFAIWVVIWAIGERNLKRVALAAQTPPAVPPAPGATLPPPAAPGATPPTAKKAWWKTAHKDAWGKIPAWIWYVIGAIGILLFLGVLDSVELREWFFETKHSGRLIFILACLAAALYASTKSTKVRGAYIGTLIAGAAAIIAFRYLQPEVSSTSTPIAAAPASQDKGTTPPTSSQAAPQGQVADASPKTPANPVVKDPAPTTRPSEQQIALSPEKPVGFQMSQTDSNGNKQEIRAATQPSVMPGGLSVGNAMNSTFIGIQQNIQAAPESKPTKVGIDVKVNGTAVTVPKPLSRIGTHDLSNRSLGEPFYKFTLSENEQAVIKLPRRGFYSIFVDHTQEVWVKNEGEVGDGFQLCTGPTDFPPVQNYTTVITARKVGTTEVTIRLTPIQRQQSVPPVSTVSYES